MRIPARGPGRPRKWKSPLIQWRADIPLEDFEFAEEERTKLGLSRAEFFHALLHHTNWSVVELHSENKKKDERIKELEKENEDLKHLVERLQERIEKLELENQALKQGRSVRSYQDARMLKALAEKAKEGVAWKALCAEVLGLRDENKIKRLLKLAFVVKKDQHNRFPDKFYPKDIAEEFKGWILKRPGEKADIIDYVLYREDTLKAAKGLLVGEAVARTVPQVQTLKSGKAAEQYLSAVLEIAYAEYARLIQQRRGKQAKEFIETEVGRRLEKALERVDPADRRRAVLAVIEEHESAWNEAFVSNLRRVAMRALTKKLEVISDVCVAS